MFNLLQSLAVCMIVVGAVLSQNIPPRFVGNNCPQLRGQFEYPGDCTKYIDCTGGVGTVSDCPPQLIFNPQTNYCDWPDRAPNPNCAGRNSPLTALNSQLCRNNPGRPGEAFHVAHPELCNAFYTCSTNYVFAPCTFCGEGSFFDPLTGACREYAITGEDVRVVCQGRTFVPHVEKVFRVLDGICWPFGNLPNPHQAVADSLRNRQG